MAHPENMYDVARIDIVDEGHSAATPRSPYFHHAVSGSTSTFNKASGSSSSIASTSSVRAQNVRLPSGLGRVTTPRIGGDSTPARPRSGSPSTVKEKEKGEKEGRRERERDKNGRTKEARPLYRTRATPHLQHVRDVETTPPTLMHWSRAPTWGVIPSRGVRAHSVTLVEDTAWVFGGCDERGCWSDVCCFHTESMEWTRPTLVGDMPPPCRAHTATLVDRRIFVIGGGEGPMYYNDVYVLDTYTRQWARVAFPPDTPVPPPRRAHTAVLYRNRIWVFGGGNGMEALNDVWTLEVSTHAERMRWEQVDTKGRRPNPRGYHTANLVGSVMVVMGGSDGRECFSDIWCLNLDTLVWTAVKLDVLYRRLSHTATQVGSYLFIMGGHDGSQYTSDLILFNLVALTFETRPVAGRAPTPRGYHVAFLADGRLFIYGGFNGSEVYDDVHLLELAGAAYLPQVTSFRIDVD